MVHLQSKVPKQIRPVAVRGLKQGVFADHLLLPLLLLVEEKEQGLLRIPAGKFRAQLDETEEIHDQVPDAFSFL